ncbi:hypothetical protein AAJ72_13385 [Citromicrobium sp. RCC1885]|uniref:hypothetical protein n=1 Tax=unclassified Citromicrobium TaxID=2630544 RepID=UPI0006C90757|nr:MULTISPECIES: hypothetical protein [unclassified Citromicrobium]KPM22137.1 hypothetical protein AAJ72_13385 [Citromicrobium sp. RCC1885]KPM24164.1 hypothetical protein AAJ74_14125 [Citromicrobium sp. RCC1878]OAM07451.1 hypothetical protein A0U43_13295 [Citromicrobium sp. RCC1897]|tara:strand:+ start:4300 stop:4779 length:480 start_codon:yes stop_codon:yes gene_type:complete
MKYFYAALATILVIAVSVIAFASLYGTLVAVPQSGSVETSYENIVVILLTTVTVIFTISALIIAILAFMGPRAIKREARKYAETALLDALDKAMKPEGKATNLLKERFPPNAGPTKDWMEERIERQVISLLPLIIDRIDLGSDVGAVDPDEPEDEGNPD